MRNRVVWLTAALVLGFVASGPGQAQQVTNLFQNPGFGDIGRVADPHRRQRHLPEG
ncbi:MAG: hypothetical protein M1376_21310 [Planctomycetes bacterium]|nr:hypothetical protein [Planctomycetota bacterium]